jgi:hypothetical protein
MLNSVTGYMQKALKSSHTGSAMSFFVWLNGLVTAPCLLLSAFVAYPMNIAFFLLAVGIVGFSLWQFRDLVKTDPHLVQSEKLQFAMAKLEWVASKGGKPVLDAVNLEFGSEPPLLTAGEPEDEGATQ